ncbi:unnamed protein product, partial [Ceratitis capitata]
KSRFVLGWSNNCGIEDIFVVAAIDVAVVDDYDDGDCTRTLIEYRNHQESHNNNKAADNQQ